MYSFFQKIYSSLLLIVLLTILIFPLFFLWNREVEQNYVSEEREMFWCGVIDNEPTCGNVIPQHMVASVEKGQAIFYTNCKACHDFNEVVVGPALKGVTKRRERDWLIQFIRNPKSMIDSGDSTATNLFKEYNAYMPSNTFLSDEEIEAIIDYLSY